MEKMEVKLGAYKSTVAMQEKVIGKLEGVIENKIREEARRGPAAWAKAEIEDKKRREELEGEMETMAAVVEDLKSGKEAAESGNAELSRDLDLGKAGGWGGWILSSSKSITPPYPPQLTVLTSTRRFRFLSSLFSLLFQPSRRS